MSFNLAPPPGFLGFDESKPIHFYTRHLPHWRQEGATYFITFRLGDSLPQSKLAELRALRDAWKRRYPPPQNEAAWQSLLRSTIARVERWLDQGIGACWLKDPELTAHLTKAMHHFDGERYELDSYVVMPNHVHAIIRPTRCNDHPLENIVGSWKQLRRVRSAVRSKPMVHYFRKNALTGSFATRSTCTVRCSTSAAIHRKPDFDAMPARPGCVPNGRLWAGDSKRKTAFPGRRITSLVDH